MYREDAYKEDFQDALNRLATDIISETEYEPFIRALLQTSPGTWARATHLCREITPLRRRIQALEQRAAMEGYVEEGRLSVRWQPYGEGFCLVTFFFDVNMWNCMHVVNPAQFRH